MLHILPIRELAHTLRNATIEFAKANQSKVAEEPVALGRKNADIRRIEASKDNFLFQCEQDLFNTIGIDVYGEIVACIYHDALMARSYAPVSSAWSTELTLESYFPWVIRRTRLIAGAVLSASFYHEVIDPIISEVYCTVTDQIFPEHSWATWTCGRLNFDVTINVGEDYRIVDWTKRHEAGEF